MGMNIAHRLLRDGWKVILYARKKPDAAYMRELERLRGEVVLEQGDVLDQDAMEALLKKHRADCVVHGAAITPDREMEERNPELILEVNCMGLLKSLLAARNCRVERFLYLGSVSAYGETAFQKETLEEGVSIGNPHSLYELSKYTGERILLRLKELYHMDARVLRIGDVYGPWERYTGDRGHMSLIYQTTVKAVQGETVSLPRSCMQDWVSGSDIAGEVKALLEAETLRYDVYPLCSGARWPLLEWCALLQQRYPAFSYKLAERPEDASIRVNQDRDNAPMSLARLREDTGYEPEQRDVKSAFGCYMNWLDEHPDFLEEMISYERQKG